MDTSVDSLYIPFHSSVPSYIHLCSFFFNETATTEIYTLSLHDALPIYSHAVEVDGWVFLTGQIPNAPGHDRAPLPEGIEAQTRQTMENLTRVLAGLGLRLEHVVAARVFLTRFDEDYQRMNRVYEGYFGSGRLPARTCIGVTALALGARIEIDFIARRP